jgi:hypothetical protein
VSFNNVLIHKSLLGSSEHLLLSKDEKGNVSYSKLRDVNHVSSDYWEFTGSLKYTNNCFDTAAKLNLQVLKTLPEQKYIDSFSFLKIHESIPWQIALPSDVYVNFIRGVIKSVISAWGNIDEEYYDIFCRQNEFLKTLKPAMVDVDRFEKFADDEDAHANNAIIKSFTPKDFSNPYLAVTQYSRFATRTGRLTTESGPMILNIKKQYRNIIKSRYVGGKIYMLDFSSLEPRGLLYENGYSCDDDLYSYISRVIPDASSYTREHIKVVVLGILYGQGKESLSKLMSIDGDMVDSLMKNINQLLGIEALKVRLREQVYKWGYISNFYGRKIEILNPSDHILVNSYAQSTGVDISLLGFSELCKGFDKSIIPLFVLHDALFVDVPPELIENVKKISNVQVQGYEYPFKLKAQELS